jgi:hypothetical protein
MRLRPAPCSGDRTRSLLGLIALRIRAQSSPSVIPNFRTLGEHITCPPSAKLTFGTMTKSAKVESRMGAVAWANRHPVIHTWSYKLAEAA